MSYLLTFINIYFFKLMGLPLSCMKGGIGYKFLKWVSCGNATPPKFGNVIDLKWIIKREMAFYVSGLIATTPWNFPCLKPFFMPWRNF
jgi:hypothetical protein